MKALVTGASSGIGREIAKYLSSLGYGVIAAARDKDRLKSLLEELRPPARVISMDLSLQENCRRLFAETENDEVDVLVNNAGFGVYGLFSETDLELELQMTGLNVEAVHMLTKLFLRQMLARDAGYIMNTASLAAYAPGPRMAAYFASKAYILSFTQAVQEELAQMRSRVHVCALCPTAVRTNFQRTANVEFDVPNQCPAFVAKAAVDGMLRRKKVIVPGWDAKAARVVLHMLPGGAAARMSSAIMRPHAQEMQLAQYTWEITEP